MNDYATHIYRKNGDLDGKNRTCWLADRICVSLFKFDIKNLKILKTKLEMQQIVVAHNSIQ